MQNRSGRSLRQECKSEVSDIYVKNELVMWAQSRNNKLSECDYFREYSKLSTLLWQY